MRQHWQKLIWFRLLSPITQVLCTLSSDIVILKVKGEPGDFIAVYESLKKNKKQNTALLTSIQNIIDSLKNDQMVGNHIKRNQIPKYYIKKHDVQVLYRVELPKFWRLAYTIITINHVKQALILDLLDHKSYDKRWGYK